MRRPPPLNGVSVAVDGDRPRHCAQLFQALLTRHPISFGVVGSLHPRRGDHARVDLERERDLFRTIARDRSWCSGREEVVDVDCERVAFEGDPPAGERVEACQPQRTRAEHAWPSLTVVDRDWRLGTVDEQEATTRHAHAQRDIECGLPVAADRLDADAREAKSSVVIPQPDRRAFAIRSGRRSGRRHLVGREIQPTRHVHRQGSLRRPRTFRRVTTW